MQRIHSFTGNSNDYYKPPAAAYDEAYSAVKKTIENFVITTPNGEKRSLLDITADHLASFSDQDRRTHDECLEQIIREAIRPLVYSGVDKRLGTNTFRGFLNVLGLLYGEPTHGPLSGQFQNLEKEIIATAETVFTAAVTADRAKTTRSVNR